MKPVRNRISLRGLRTFCIVAQRGSFRLAAEDLFLTPSAISHQIKSLENELDAKLFDRRARELQLTDAGSTLLRESSPLISQLDQVASRFSRALRPAPTASDGAALLCHRATGAEVIQFYQ